MINVALIGAGRWGQVYIKTLKNIEDVNLSTYTRNYKDALKDKNIDCVIVATPKETHYQITKDALLAGKHVLVEKPFTDNSEKALELWELSNKLDRILLVDHIYLHHTGIIKLKELIDTQYLGEFEEYNSVRMSKSNDSNSLWEMATHDLYILDYFLSNDNIENIELLGKDLEHCHIIIRYLENKYAFIESSSSYPEKIRQITITGTKKIAIFNDINIMLIDKESSTKEILFLDDTNVTPLEKQCRHFFDCILNGNIPISGAYNGYRNVKLLERINMLLNEIRYN